MSYERDMLHAAEHPPEGETCPECGGYGIETYMDHLGVDYVKGTCPRCDGLGYLVPDGDALADEAGDRMYDDRNDR